MKPYRPGNIQRLNYQSFPYRLYEKAKKFGIWDPAGIDLSVDKKYWEQAAGRTKVTMLKLIALFQAGEAAVTQDLLPLISVIAKEGRLEEQLFLTTFLWEEAKHVEFFCRWLDEVAGELGDLSNLLCQSYQEIVSNRLPKAMNRLYQDCSPAAQMEASITYNVIGEGVLAKTGYFSFKHVLKETEYPGLLQGLMYIERDESRHVGYGMYLLQRLLCDNPDLWETFIIKIDELMPLALDALTKSFTHKNNNQHSRLVDACTGFASKQLQVILKEISKARGQTTVEELYIQK